MTPLQSILAKYRNDSASEREKGTYFEELIRTYFRYEATYRDLYSDVWLYSDWAKTQGLDGRDTGIDLVAKTQGTNEYHAIQCKCYAEDYCVRKADIDSFFTASGKKPFTHRVIVTTTSNWSEHAEDALQNQQPPVTKIDLNDLENSQIDWAKYKPNAAPVLKQKKSLRPHQLNALNGARAGLQIADRGKLIMACGTGKTFTSLKIAEELAGNGKRVLFLVPSLSLLSQTLTEWTQESETLLHSFAVCSDSHTGKKRNKDEDVVHTFTHELRYPATTEPKRLAEEMAKRHDANHMSVVFSTYHSIDVISKAQKEFNLANFDLIICDEAHRTTGATFDNESESNFVKVHNNDFIKSAKRIYMTATPRIYADIAKANADKDNVALCSMDDETLYGKELYIITFSEAVSRGLLCDYKVIVLTVDEAHVSARLQNLLKDENNSLKVDDAAKIVGCWKALSKQGAEDDLINDIEPMRRAVAFCQVIEAQNKSTKHKVSSKQISGMFQSVVEAYQEQEDNHNTLICEAAHVDGGMNATQKEEKLNWLKANLPDNTCRILSNVRCLSEGVDVPALDAVLFLTPRNSQVDVVQSVGRVMRNAPNKKMGYVILPVVIPAGMTPAEALNDNKTYKVVWEVLQALRSHDDRFDAMINKLDLIGRDNKKMEVIAITDKITKKSEGKPKKKTGKGTYGIGEEHKEYEVQPEQLGMTFEVGEIERALYAKVVQKCGNRNHWGDWANDIAKIANTHITRIKTIVENPANTEEQKAFAEFAHELRDDLNDSISDGEVIEMLAQHLITKPVFDALFSDYSFAQHNPMSQAMQGVLDVLQDHNLNKETDTLEKFYASVKMRAEGIDNAQGKQKIIVELYDKFFAKAFPKLRDKLGIVYTPVEVVDFIIHSVNDILKQEFNQTLGSEGVHIVDPFTGTGTFITRLLQSGLIPVDKLKQKYKSEIHANEIVLLAYYIAAINIEAVYHSLVGGNYVPFEGICLTDTFQLYEKDDLVDQILIQNSARRKRQKSLKDIRVIIGNPPYSSGQKSENDNNQKTSYEILDGRIKETYAFHSNATLKNSLYNSYVRAIRWASDRLGDNGVLGFVSGSGFVDKPAMDGMRKCLESEFSSIYIFNLRGDIRKNMLSKGKAKEGQNIFESNSMSGIAISFLVKNPKSNKHGNVYYYDIGDDLKTDDKLNKIKELRSAGYMSDSGLWSEITSDEHNDWLTQRDTFTDFFIEIGNKKDKSRSTIFENYSSGVKTNRDAWVYNYSKKSLSLNMNLTIEFYNKEVERCKSIFANKNNKFSSLEGLLSDDAKSISWTDNLKLDLTRGVKHIKREDAYVVAMYRPFVKRWFYFDKNFNQRRYQMPSIFPESETVNYLICLSGVGARSGFSSFIVNSLPDLELIEKSQCFPLYLYEKSSNDDQIDFDDKLQIVDLFAGQVNQRTEVNDSEYQRKDGISDTGLAHFTAAYPNEKISKKDVFYYVYGLLHSSDYRERYADNLSKELPRIPCVKTASNFWAFSKAGRDLAELHLNYETVDCYPVTLDVGKKKITELEDKDYYVTKMKFAKKGEKHTVIYNNKITIRDIPEAAFDYVVNGKAALDWVMERQAVTTHKESGIVNDANDWAIETMGNAKYPLELFMRVITVSIETMKIVKALPKLDIN